MSYRERKWVKLDRYQKKRGDASMYRKQRLVTGEIYHIYNKSIADYEIFNTDSEYRRMKEIIRYYQLNAMPYRFS